jgi:hypothetical protein
VDAINIDYYLGGFKSDDSRPMTLVIRDIEFISDDVLWRRFFTKESGCFFTVDLGFDKMNDNISDKVLHLKQILVCLAYVLQKACHGPKDAHDFIRQVGHLIYYKPGFSTRCTIDLFNFFTICPAKQMNVPLIRINPINNLT